MIDRKAQLRKCLIVAALASFPASATATAYQMDAQGFPSDVIPNNLGIVARANYSKAPYDDERWAALTNFNVGIIRDGFAWKDVEKTAGVYDYTKVDALINAYGPRGYRATIGIDYSNPLYQVTSTTDTAGRLRLWQKMAEYAKAVAVRTCSIDPIFTVLNEFNYHVFYDKALPSIGTAPQDDIRSSHLVEAVSAVAPAIKQGCPTAIVVGADLAGAPYNFLKLASQKGLLTYSDAIAMHPYRFSISSDPAKPTPMYRRIPEFMLAPDPASSSSTYVDFRSLIDSYAPAGKRVELMMTENNYLFIPNIKYNDPATYFCKSLEDQAIYNARMVLVGIMSRLRAIVPYEFLDKPWAVSDNPNDPKRGERESNMGMMFQSSTSPKGFQVDPKPTYDSVATIGRVLRGYRYNRRLQAGATDYIIEFVNAAGEAKYAAWLANPEGGTRDVTIAVPGITAAHTVVQYNYLGQTMTPDALPQNGTARFRLTREPRYIEFKAPATDATPPTVSITAPAPGTYVRSTISVAGTAGDNVGVVGVQFKLDGVNLGVEDTAAPYSVSWNTSLSSAGAHILTAAARDAAGNQTTSASVAVTIDNASPAISGVAAASISSTGATINWTTNEPSDSQVRYGTSTSYGGTTTLDAAQVTSHSVFLSGLLPATLYHFKPLSRDRAGNVGGLSADYTFTTVSGVDAILPTAAVTFPADGATVTGTVIVTADAADNVGVAGVRFKLDGGDLGGEDATAPYSASWNTAVSSDGTHTLTVVARDAAGNTATAAPVTVIVDNNAPVISNVAMTMIGSSSAAVQWTTSEPADTQAEYGLTVAYGTSTSLGANLVRTHTATLRNLIPNTVYHYRVRSRDGAGNLALSADATFITASSADATPPAVSITAPAAGGWARGMVAVSVAATDNVGVVGVQFKLDGADLGVEDLSAPYGFAWDTSLVSDGPHALTAVARDAAGNAATSASVAVTVDNAFPIISGVSATNISSTTAKIVWTTDESSDSQVRYGTSTSYGNSTAVAPALVTSHSMTLQALSPNTLYHYKVLSRDPAGNVGGLSSDYTFTTASAADAAPPAVSITAPVAGATLAGTTVVAASASDDVGVAGVQFKLGGTNLGAEDVAAPFSATWNTASAANGSYMLTAVARDAAGNTTTSAIVTVTVDNLAPSLSGVSANNVTASGATIVWTTNEPADTQVEYGLTTSYGSQTALDPAFATSHSVPLSGLSPNTLYHYRVRSKDRMGNQAVSADATFTTAALADTTAPTVSLTAPADGSTVDGIVAITASAADNVGVAGVQFRVDGVNVGAEDLTAPFGANWDTSSAASGWHQLTAVARDAAGNKTTSASRKVRVKRTSVRLNRTASGTTTLANAAPSDDAILIVKSDDPEFPAAAAITARLALPSGERDFNLVQLPENPTVFFAKYPAASFTAQDYAALNGGQWPVTTAGKSFSAVGEAHTIVPELGGVVSEPAGQASVALRPGAVSAEARIDILPESADESGRRAQALAKQGLKAAGPGREVEMSGPETLQSAILSLPYDAAAIPAGRSVNDLRIAYFNPNTGLWEPLDTVAAGGALRAQVAHFSLYAPVLVMPSAASGLRDCYAFPNPAVAPADPTIRASLGVATAVEVTIFDASGAMVHSASVSGAPSGIAGGEYYYDYTWRGRKPSGIYFAVVHGKAADGTVVRARAKFAVVR